MTAMDGATIKGVVDRLVRQGLVKTSPDPQDRRRLTIALSPAGQALFAALFQDTRHHGSSPRTEPRKLDAHSRRAF